MIPLSKAIIYFLSIKHEINIVKIGDKSSTNHKPQLIGWIDTILDIQPATPSL